jgi:hypothetical protein
MPDSRWLLIGTILFACSASSPPLVSDAAGGRLARMACGPALSCDRNVRYCSVFLGGPRGVPPTYRCLDFPEACGVPASCDCIPVPIGCVCEGSEGRITVTCTAP